MVLLDHPWAEVQHWACRALRNLSHSQNTDNKAAIRHCGPLALVCLLQATWDNEVP